MKISKKIGLGLASLLLILVGSITLAGKVSAVTKPQNFGSDPSALFNTKFVYKNGQILATITDISVPNQPSYDLTFVQNGSNKLEYDSSQKLFCQSNVQIVAAPAKLTLTKSPAGSSFPGNLDVYVWVQAGSACKHYSATKTIDNQDTGSGGNTGPPTTLAYNNATYEQIAGTELYGLNKTKGTDCYGGSVILANSAFSSGTAFVGLEGNGGAVPLQPSFVKAGASAKTVTLITGCGFKDPAAKTDGYSGSISNGKLNAPVPPSGGGGTGTVAEDNSCEASYTGAAHTLNWLFCSILEGFDSMFNTIYGVIESQLNICTGKSSTTGQTCGNNILGPEVEKSWAVFRDLATALLVIAMLVMVFSQAISAGPFDAYTVRKMLPRLAAAAILIQISWPLLKFFVDISNDLGQGIASLMLAPFGGAAKMAFDNQIGSAGNWAPGVTLLSTAVFTGAAIAFSGVTIIGWMLVGVSAIASLLVGLLVLLFRQMLIILAVILAPLALIAYVMPGTQKYFKLWQDNFTKLLFMFPLIMAMIAAGKIFAFVGTSTGSGFLGLIVVLVGFLGPLWFLPKTFRWGGQIFASAATGALNATKGIRGGAGKYALNQAKANREQRATDRNERLSYGRGRRFDRLYAAAPGIGLTPRGREVRNARNRAEGREAGEKAVAQAVLSSAYETQDHQEKLVTLDYVAQGQTDPQTGLDGSNPAAQRWALDQLATFGDWDRIDLLRASGNLDERVWQSFMAKNISAVHQNAPYLSPLRRDMSQLGYHEAGTWKDHAIHEFERQIVTGQIRTADGQGYEAATDPDRQLALGVDFATRALSDERVRANLSADGIATLERVRDLASPEVSITPSRQPGQLPNVRIPSAVAIHNNPRARESLTNALIHPDPNTRQAASQSLASRLADPSQDPASKQMLEQFMQDFRRQAEASGLPEAASSYNETINQWGVQIQNRPQDVERQAIAQGAQGPAIAQARNDAQIEADNEQRRIQASGLLPLP